jgi:hypothetical protein
MPDIQTALKTALSTWEKDDQQTIKEKTMPKNIFKPTNNVSRDTFNYIKHNPNMNSADICTALIAQGHKRTSIHSLLTQMLRGGLVQRVDEKFTALIDEYRPMKSYKQLKNVERKKQKLLAKPTGKSQNKPKAKGITALVGPSASKAQVTTVWDAETVINNIGLKQAHALYKELSTYFGG